jgi:hypothetical protein
LNHQQKMPGKGAALRLAPTIAAGLSSNRYSDHEERTAEIVGSTSYLMDSREDGGW